MRSSEGAMSASAETVPVTRQNPARSLALRGTSGAYVLRALEVSDAPILERAVSASVPELRAFMPWAHLPRSLEREVARLKTVEADNRSGRELQLGLFAESDASELLACLGIHARVPLNPRGVELGYWTASAHAGRGLATIAVRMATVYAVDLLGCDRVQIVCDEANVASVRVAMKSGFVREGKLAGYLAAPSPEIVAGGYRGGTDPLMFAMVPARLAELAWADEVRGALEVFDILGRALPGWPRA